MRKKNTIDAKFWNYNYWVRFTFDPGVGYANFLEFLDGSDISIINELSLDYDNIPLPLHGNGVSKNLLDYISNNNQDSTLIMNFLSYFILFIVKIRYFYTDTPIYFTFDYSDEWQSTTFTAYEESPDASVNNYVENDYIDNYFI